MRVTEYAKLNYFCYRPTDRPTPLFAFL